MTSTIIRKQSQLFSIGRCISRFSPATSTKLNYSSVQSFNQDYSHDQNKNRWSKHWRYAFSLGLSTTSLLALKVLYDLETYSAECAEKETKGVYSRHEVSEKRTLETGFWVIYGHNVYDITDFISSHPGGSEKIVLAAGGNLEPFWDLYAIHKKQEVLDILKEYHIGELREEDRVVEEKREGPFANDPKRHPALVINAKEPFNAETPPALAVESLVTSNDLFYVRNHLPVPYLDESECELVIDGLGEDKSIVLSVEEIKAKYKHHKVICAIQCAGNRRNEMNTIKQVRGLTWSSNAISNAEWTGVLLKDVLIDAGVDPEDSSVKHLHFEGADVGPTGAPYGASIPANRVFKKNMPIMIAFEMNGEPIPRDHGFPLRLVAPGIVGARNVKWLNRLVVSDEEYGGHWQQKDYKPFSPNIDWHNVDFSKSPSIQELPVTSAICSPQEGASYCRDDEEIVAKGYAFSGGGNGIVRVDLSVDGGLNWYTAELTQADQELDSMYSWTLWKCALPIPEDCKDKVEILCRAVDSACNTQPEGVGPVWNLRGVLNNSWHQVNVNVLNDDEDEK